LGRLPDANQVVKIETGSEKTVVIDAVTARDFPTSLMLHNLVLSNSNTLKLDRIENNGSLRFDVGTNRWIGLELLRGARLINLESEITLDGFLRMIGGYAGQDGGTVLVKRRNLRDNRGSSGCWNRYWLNENLDCGIQLNLAADSAGKNGVGSATNMEINDGSGARR
jgi:hypothetical protein